eukprot:358445-Chlamydomonas_euryale.AAC.10
MAHPVVWWRAKCGRLEWRAVNRPPGCDVDLCPIQEASGIVEVASTAKLHVNSVEFCSCAVIRVVAAVSRPGPLRPVCHTSRYTRKQADAAESTGRCAEHRSVQQLDGDSVVHICHLRGCGISCATLVAPCIAVHAHHMHAHSRESYVFHSVAGRACVQQARYGA